MSVVRAMTDALAHRGPDGSGVTKCSGRDAAAEAAPITVLGHRRLAIIDLSDRALQPMGSPDAPVWISYNGETYNFKALRRELEGLGHHFHSDSDTEVLLRGYEQWRDRVVDRLRGMFAFAIWNGHTNTLVLARDRLGIKPLYLHRTGKYLLFASEVRALLASGLVPRLLDLEALDQFLAYQTVAPPKTLVRDIEMMQPGHVAVFRAGVPCVDRQYWHLLETPATVDATDAGQVSARVSELLAESASLHLVSDVPVGVFLSGGIDSSALVALVRRAGATPHTYTVACAGTSVDEGPFARTVADAFETDHQEIRLAEAELLEQLPGALASVDHPSGDGINTYIVSRAVRAAGVKVALSGLGGDEFFGGYPSFRRMDRLARLAPAWGPVSLPARRAAAVALRSIGRSSVASIKTAALLECDGTFPQAFPVMRQLFSPVQRGELLDRTQVPNGIDSYIALLEHAVERDATNRRMSLVSYAEARTYMHDVLLRDTDQMSMAHALEIRVPLLDHKLVEYLMGLPDSAKHRSAAPKSLLVDSLGVRLPEVVRRPKQGFVLPFAAWMKRDLRELCEHNLGSEGLGGRPLFRRAAVEDLWRAFLDGDRRTSWSRPWTLIALNAWLDHNRIAS